MRRLVCLLPCLALVVLAGCSDPQASPPPDPQEPVAATSQSPEGTATSAPDDAVQTTSPVDADREDPGVPELPPEAMEDTEAGAEAFVQYYVDLLNYTGKFPQSGLLEPFSDEACATCEAFETEVIELDSRSEHYDSDALQPFAMTTIRFQGDSQVTVQSFAPAANRLDVNGKILSSTEEVEKLEWLVELTPSEGSFVVKGIKYVE